MSNKHTPGPWIVESDGTTVSMSGQCVIVSPAPDNASRDVAMANARLIAAAPDLLASLAEFSGVWERGDTFGAGTPFVAFTLAVGQQYPGDCLSVVGQAFGDFARGHSRLSVHAGAVLVPGDAFGWASRYLRSQGIGSAMSSRSARSMACTTAASPWFLRIKPRKLRELFAAHPLPVRKARQWPKIGSGSPLAGGADAPDVVGILEDEDEDEEPSPKGGFGADLGVFLGASFGVFPRGCSSSSNLEL